MLKIIRILLILFFPILLISLIIFSYNVIKISYQYAYQSSMVYQNMYAWHKHLIFDKIYNFLNSITKNKNGTSFPEVKIYISDQSSKKLIDNLPASTKKWAKSYINYPDYNIDLQEIKLRYRGDNPANWLKTKKFFKIKTKKKELINTNRNLEYHIYNSKKYFPYFILKKMDLLTQDPKLVEVYFNERSKGLYFEIEEIDESFLRKNKLMPVNIYKGENHATEFKIGLNRDIFKNSGLWKKTSKFNQDNDSFDDLDHFLNRLNSNNKEINWPLEDYIDFSYFSKFDAFLTLTGNYHHDFFHNMRLVLDPWSGNITQVIVDPIITSVNDLQLDFASNDLSLYLNKKSDFIHEKYKWLNYYLNKKDIIKEVLDHYNLIEDNLLIIQKKEPYDEYYQEHTENTKEVINLLKLNKKFILDKLNSQPKSSWNKNIIGFEISINDFTPLSEIRTTFKNGLAPKWIGIDLNYDNQISESEPKFFIKNPTEIQLPIVLYSNRFKRINNTYFNHANFSIDHNETYFRFITENGSIPEKIEGKNFFNKKNFVISESKFNNGVKSSVNNNIVYLEKSQEELITRISGEVIVEDNLIFNNKVSIAAGTRFLIESGKHIIFKNQVIMNGGLDKPILFQKKNNTSNPWGTVALLGKKTKGSLINFVSFDGGSGGEFNQYKFTSMFSVHNSSEIKILNSTFSNNKNYDDTIHIIYSNNLLLKNLNIFNAFSDAIDIDISKDITINDIEIKNSGNDGLDLMESNLKINNLNVFNSKDKCISVGENSKAEINNSKLINCNIGIASKDKSLANLNNSEIINNNYQLAAYAKNWRYGEGGQIIVDKSYINSIANNFVTSSDPEDIEKKTIKFLNQNSKITIFNSKINGKNNLLGKNININ